MKLYVEKVTGYDELEENVFTVEMADCPEVVSVTLASRFHDYNSWQETSKAIAEAIGLITKDTKAKEPLAVTPPEEKWTRWAASLDMHPPVPDHQFIRVRFGSGYEDTGYPDLWDWSQQEDSRDEIIAYREIDL